MNQIQSPSATDPEIDQILNQVVAGERLTDANAERLLASPDLLAIGRAAHAVRQRLQPEPVVTYIIDRNVNYTNVCVTDCSFCAFYRHEGDPDAYVLNHDQLRRKIDETYEAGGRQILMQGGHNPKLEMEWYENLLRWLKSEFPDLHIHAFSPPELHFFSETFGLSLEEVISRLREAGLDSIPGGGAEILVDRVRGRISPLKVSSDQWIEVMRTAHRLGLRTSATMVFGIIETPAERIEHLRRIRDLQDITGGFTAFIDWTFQYKNASPQDNSRAGAFDYLKTTAIARLYLDNIPNIQASWVTQGDKIAQMNLLMGANDLGSLMLEENVVSAAGTHFEYSVEHLRRLAAEVGFELRQRDFFYQPFEAASPKITAGK